MDKKISLNGQWTLYFYDAVNGQTATPATLAESGFASIPAQVPGNVELDLIRAGLLPGDIFRGMNICETEKYETYEWWYCTEFDTPAVKTGEQVQLQFDGVDCVADYYLNGELVYQSKNMFISHAFEVTDRLIPEGRNTLQVHIRSALIEGIQSPSETYTLTEWVHVRKPAHSNGWDIFPRTACAGLWKDVSLVVSNGYGFEEISYVVRSVDPRNTNVLISYSVKAPLPDLICKKLKITFRGTCGDSVFEGSTVLDRRRSGRIGCPVAEPKLWWPYGYGEANVYDLVVQLWREDELVAEKTMNVGLRTLELRRTDLLTDANPDFCFVVNGVDIMCRGSNWVPLDAFHSRDKERYAKALELTTDIGCNILRVWGGGVYEQECFYDYCDRHGIMVWQDFMMACRICPMYDEMMKNLEQEFSWVIHTLRHHPSIVLWSGDNEIDEALAINGYNPEMHTITRELLPRLVQRYDPFRPYLASSPYLTGAAFMKYRKEDVFPERHLWGPRDYYKADFYAQSKACFVSETGYHGCPSPESVRKIVDEDCVWPYSNAQWTLHSSDQNGSDHRVRLMADQIRQLFAFEPKDIEEFSLASQISQAEAKKFFIERIRVGRPQKTGIIWWNLLDGWPQMSDAVVDYFYDKKLAYHYIKRSQAPVALMVREMEGWHYTLVAANDTLQPVKGTYRVTDIETGELLAEGNFDAPANASTEVCKIRMMYSDQRMMLIQWNIDGKVAYNHYLCGMPAFSYEKYVGWLQKLQAICGE